MLNQKIMTNKKFKYSKYFYILFLAISGVFFVPTKHILPEVVDKVIAIVNDKVITYSDLMRMLFPIYEKYRKVYDKEELEKKLKNAKKNILNQLIENELILQEAKKRAKDDKDLNIPEEKIDEAIAAIIKNYPSKEAFMKTLEKEKMTMKEFRENIKNQLIAKKLTAKEISARIMVTPKDIIERYNKNKEKYIQPAEYHIYHIQINKTGDEEKDKELKKMLEEIASKTTDANSFQQYAIKYSQGANRENGGDMGFIKKGTLIKELDSQIEKMKPGTVSPVIETNIGYHLLFLDAVKKKTYIPLKDVWKKIESEIYFERAEKIRRQWINELKKKAYIKIIDE